MYAFAGTSVPGGYPQNYPYPDAQILPQTVPFFSVATERPPAPNGRYTSADVCRLIIRQQPQECLVVNEGRERARKVVDPAPILQLQMSSQKDPNQYYMQSPYLFAVVSLWKADRQEPFEDPTALIGGLNSSLHRFKDTDNTDGAFFVFGDISIKKKGTFRLQFTLFDLDKSSNADAQRGAQNLFSVTSNPFKVVSPKDYRGVQESTYLSRAFSDQGCKLKLRKEPRAIDRGKRPFHHEHGPGSRSPHGPGSGASNVRGPGSGFPHELRPGASNVRRPGSNGHGPNTSMPPPRSDPHRQSRPMQPPAPHYEGRNGGSSSMKHFRPDHGHQHNVPHTGTTGVANSSMAGGQSSGNKSSPSLTRTSEPMAGGQSSGYPSSPTLTRTSEPMAGGQSSAGYASYPSQPPTTGQSSDFTPYSSHVPPVSEPMAGGQSSEYTSYSSHPNTTSSAYSMPPVGSTLTSGFPPFLHPPLSLSTGRSSSYNHPGHPTTSGGSMTMGDQENFMPISQPPTRFSYSIGPPPDTNAPGPLFSDDQFMGSGHSGPRARRASLNGNQMDDIGHNIPQFMELTQPTGQHTMQQQDPFYQRPRSLSFRDMPFSQAPDTIGPADATHAPHHSQGQPQQPMQQPQFGQPGLDVAGLNLPDQRNYLPTDETSWNSHPPPYGTENFHFPG